MRSWEHPPGDAQKTAGESLCHEPGLAQTGRMRGRGVGETLVDILHKEGPQGLFRRARSAIAGCACWQHTTDCFTDYDVCPHKIIPSVSHWHATILGFAASRACCMLMCSAEGCNVKSWCPRHL